MDRDGSAPPADETGTSPSASDDDNDGHEGGTERGGDSVGRPVRRGSVDLRTVDGEVVHHDEAFVRYDPEAFVVGPDQSFPSGETVRYPKETVAWIQVRHPRR